MEQIAHFHNINIQFFRLYSSQLSSCLWTLRLLQINRVSQRQSGIGAKICKAQAQGGLGSTPARVKTSIHHEKKNSFCQNHRHSLCTLKKQVNGWYHRLECERDKKWDDVCLFEGNQRCYTLWCLLSLLPFKTVNIPCYEDLPNHDAPNWCLIKFTFLQMTYLSKIQFGECIFLQKKIYYFYLTKYLLFVKLFFYRKSTIHWIGRYFKWDDFLLNRYILFMRKELKLVSFYKVGRY